MISFTTYHIVLCIVFLSALVIVLIPDTYAANVSPKTIYLRDLPETVTIEDISNYSPGTLIDIKITYPDGSVFLDRTEIDQNNRFKFMIDLDVYAPEGDYHIIVYDVRQHVDSFRIPPNIGTRPVPQTDPATPDPINPDGSSTTPNDASALAFFIDNPVILIGVLVLGAAGIVAVSLSRKSRTTTVTTTTPSSAPFPPRSPASKNISEPSTNRFYECPYCHKPDLDHHQHSRNHPKGYVKCTCGFKFDLEKQAEF